MSKTFPARSQTALQPKVWAKVALKWRAFVSGLIVLTLLGSSLAPVAQATTPGERAPAGAADSDLAPETDPAAAPLDRESPEPVDDNSDDDRMVDDDNMIEIDLKQRETPAVRNLAPDKAEPDDHCAQARPQQPNEPSQHSLHTPKDVDWVKLEIAKVEEQDFFLETSRASRIGGTKMWVYSACPREENQAALAYRDGQDSFAKIKNPFPQAGAYYVKIASNQKILPDYTFNLRTELKPWVQEQREEPPLEALQLEELRSPNQPPQGGFPKGQFLPEVREPASLILTPQQVEELRLPANRDPEAEEARDEREQERLQLTVPRSPEREELEYYNKASTGWQTIMTENGEGSFPRGNNWRVYDDNSGSGRDYWDDLSCRDHWGRYSIWASDIGDMRNCQRYDNNMNAWMIYGPFDLSDATQAKLEFYYWNNTESGYDYFKWLASSNGRNFQGDQTSGNSGGWRSQTLDLASYVGDSSVWVAFLFESDGSVTREGAYVDDITLKKSVTVGQPDLTKARDSLNKTTFTPGETLNFNLTVKNQGNGTASASYVYYYLKKGGRTYSNTYKVGYDYFTSLSPNSTSQESFSYRLPSNLSPGTYSFYYWIDAPGNVRESNENNNKYSKSLTIQTTDDRYEENDTLSRAYDLRSSEGRWLSSINGKGIQADHDWYKIYVNSGEERVKIDCRFTHSAGDIDLALYNASGSQLVGSAGTRDNELIDYTVPGSGTYYLKVYYANRGNQYDLKWDDLPAAKPDLTKASNSLNKTTFKPGETLNFNLTVKNQGAGSAGSSSVYYYFKKGGRTYSNTYKVGSDTVASLSPNSTTQESFSYTLPTNLSPGTYYFYYWIDATGNVRESNENNNRYYWQLTVVQPDLTKTRDSLNKTTFTPGETLNFNLTVKNQGAGSAGSSSVYYYFKKGGRTYSNTYKVGRDTVASLSPNSTTQESFSYTLPSNLTPGTYYFYYWLDATGNVRESNENNNKYSKQLTIEAPAATDLRVQLLQAERYIEEDGKQNGIYLQGGNLLIKVGANYLNPSQTRVEIWKAQKNAAGELEKKEEIGSAQKLASAGIVARAFSKALVEKDFNYTLPPAAQVGYYLAVAKAGETLTQEVPFYVIYNAKDWFKEARNNNEEAVNANNYYDFFVKRSKVDWYAPDSSKNVVKLDHYTLHHHDSEYKEAGLFSDAKGIIFKKAIADIAGDTNTSASLDKLWRLSNKNRAWSYGAGCSKNDQDTIKCLKYNKVQCQDFAHLLLDYARAMGLPARIASGISFKFPTGKSGETSIWNHHQWVEAYKKDTKEWYVYDATPNVNSNNGPFPIPKVWPRLRELAGMKRGTQEEYGKEEIIRFNTDESDAPGVYSSEPGEKKINLTKKYKAKSPYALIKNLELQTSRDISRRANPRHLLAAQDPAVFLERKLISYDLDEISTSEERKLKKIDKIKLADYLPKIIKKYFTVSHFPESLTPENYVLFGAYTYNSDYTSVFYINDSGSNSYATSYRELEEVVPSIKGEYKLIILKNETPVYLEFLIVSPFEGVNVPYREGDDLISKEEAQEIMQSYNPNSEILEIKLEEEEIGKNKDKYKYWHGKVQHPKYDEIKYHGWKDSDKEAFIRINAKNGKFIIGLMSTNLNITAADLERAEKSWYQRFLDWLLSQENLSPSEQAKLRELQKRPSKLLASLRADYSTRYANYLAEQENQTDKVTEPNTPPNPEPTDTPLNPFSPAVKPPTEREALPLKPQPSSVSVRFTLTNTGQITLLGKDDPADTEAARTLLEIVPVKNRRPVPEKIQTITSGIKIPAGQTQDFRFDLSLSPTDYDNIIVVLREYRETINAAGEVLSSTPQMAILTSETSSNPAPLNSLSANTSRTTVTSVTPTGLSYETAGSNGLIQITESTTSTEPTSYRKEEITLQNRENHRNTHTYTYNIDTTGATITSPITDPNIHSLSLAKEQTETRQTVTYLFTKKPARITESTNTLTVAWDFTLAPSASTALYLYRQEVVGRVAAETSYQNLAQAIITQDDPIMFLELTSASEYRTIEPVTATLSIQNAAPRELKPELQFTISGPPAPGLSMAGDEQFYQVSKTLSIPGQSAIELPLSYEDHGSLQETRYDLTATLGAQSTSTTTKIQSAYDISITAAEQIDENETLPVQLTVRNKWATEVKDITVTLRTNFFTTEHFSQTLNLDAQGTATAEWLLTPTDYGNPTLEFIVSSPQGGTQYTYQSVRVLGLPHLSTDLDSENEISSGTTTPITVSLYNAGDYPAANLQVELKLHPSLNTATPLTQTVSIPARATETLTWNVGGSTPGNFSYAVVLDAEGPHSALKYGALLVNE